MRCGTGGLPSRPCRGPRRWADSDSHRRRQRPRDRRRRGGHGLWPALLTQRATRLGGDIDAGWSPDGFRLRAHLPRVGMTKVLVVDDQQLLRRGLRMLLSTVDGIEVVGEAGDGEEALAVIPRLHPDVVVTDARMPRMDGPSLVAACRDRHPLLPVLVLTTFDEPDVVRGRWVPGRPASCSRTSLPSGLAEGIWAAERGELVIDPRVARVALGAAPSAGVKDPRAADPDRAGGRRAGRPRMTNPEIAADLVVAEGTVKNHLTSLLRKLDQPNRTALARCCTRPSWAVGVERRGHPGDGRRRRPHGIPTQEERSTRTRAARGRPSPRPQFAHRRAG